MPVVILVLLKSLALLLRQKGSRGNARYDGLGNRSFDRRRSALRHVEGEDRGVEQANSDPKVTQLLCGVAIDVRWGSNDQTELPAVCVCSTMECRRNELTGEGEERW